MATDTQTKTTQKGYNTTDLASDVAATFGYTKAQAARIVSAVFTLIGNAVAEGKLVRIHSFGNFKPIHMAERQGRNPQTGEVTQIPATIRPHFTAGQNLKNKVRTGTVEKIDVAVPASPATSKPSTKSSTKPSVKPSAPKQRPAPKTKVVTSKPAAPAAPRIDANDIADISDL